MGEKDDEHANEERARRPPPFPFPGEGRLSLPLDAFFLISWDSPTSQDLKENERRNQIGRDVAWTTDIRSLQVPETIPLHVELPPSPPQPFPSSRDLRSRSLLLSLLLSHHLLSQLLPEKESRRKEGRWSEKSRTVRNEGEERSEAHVAD